MWVLSVRDIWDELGDVGFLKKMYPQIKLLLERATEMIDPGNGLLKSDHWNLLEWSKVSIQHPYMLYNSLLFKGALDAASVLAEPAGEGAETVETFRDTAGKLTDAINRMWNSHHLAYHESMDSDGNRIEQYSVHTSMLALLYDVIPEKFRSSASANTVTPRSTLIPVVSPFFCAFWFEALEKLGKSKFRSSFHLTEEDRSYLKEKGPEVIRRHACDFVQQKLAPPDPVNDGKQTPMRGHPVFKAMHATACCCRGCLSKWYMVPLHRVLSANEQERIVNLLMAWLEKEDPDYRSLH